jgi:hypothetical protein
MLRIALGLLVVFGVVSADAAELQARLIRATNDVDKPDDRLRDIQKGLKKKFGYERSVQLGDQRASLAAKSPQRLNLGEGFVVFVTPKSVAKSTHEMDIEWTSGRASLVKSTVKIATKNTLFVKGPAVGNDWIVLALTVRE